jgi:P4 family phage/plasmid primase-like protien
MRAALDAAATLLPSIGPRSFALEKQCDNDPSLWIGQTFTIEPDAAIGFLKLHNPDGPWALVALDPLNRKLNKWTDRQTGESKSSDEVAAVFFPNGNGPKNCRNWIMEQNRRGFKVYYHVNQIGPATGKDGSEYYPRKKAGNDRVRCVNYLHFDRDPHQLEIGTREVILDSLQTAFNHHQFKPTFLVGSGRGVQGLHRLREPVTLTGKSDDPNIVRLANHNRGLARLLVSDKSTVDVSRILALPGLIAFPSLAKVEKHRAAPILAELLEYNPDATVTLDQIAPWDGGDVTPDNSPASTALAQSPAMGTPPLDAGSIDPRFRDIADKHRDKLTTDRLDLLKRLSAVQLEKLNRNLTPDDCKLSDLPKVQAAHCVTKVEDVLIDADSRPSGRKPGCGYTDSEPMVAFAGQALRDGADLSDVCSILANRNLAISRHVYKDDNANTQLRAIVRAVATAVCTEDLPATVDAPDGIIPLSEDHLSYTFVSHVAMELRYVNEWGQWMEWDGTRWKAEKTLRAFDRAREVCRAAANMLPPDKRRGWMVDAKTIAAVERIAKSDRRVAITAEVFDTRIDLLNTPEYIVDLNTGDTLPHDPNLYCTMSTAVSPAPSETPCPLWMKFLRDVTGDNADYIAFLQRAAGYTLTGEIKEHSLFFGHGTGGNGKGVFIETIRYILGDYATSIPISSLVVTANQQHPTDLAGLRGARMVTADETEQGQQWAESKIKYMTGGSKIKARFMRQDFFEFDPQFKLWIMGNHRPRLNNVDEAIRRRLHLLPFNVTIPDERKDKDLVMKLRAESPAIMRWMLDGCLQWRRNGLHPPTLITEATMKYLQGEDYIGQWLAERTVSSADGRVKHGDLFESWRHFAEQNNIPVNSTRWLTNQLESHGLTDAGHGNAGKVWLGFRFTEAERTRIESWRQTKEEDRRLRKEALRQLGTVVPKVFVTDEESPF